MKKLVSRPNVLGLFLLICVPLLALGVPVASANFTVWGKPGNGNGEFDAPWDVAVASSGDVYIADRGNHRVQRFSTSGNYVSKFGSLGTGPGQFGDDLVAVAVSPDGKVFALDVRSSGGTGFRVQRFGADGSYETGWGTEEGTGMGQFDEPTDIAVGPDGRVYVSEAGNHRIQSFDPDGTDPATWGTAGSGGEGEFADPIGVAVRPDSGDVYVADGGGTPQVQVFSADGDFQFEWGETGSGLGQFPGKGLVAMAIGVDGDVYTRTISTFDATGSRFQRFDPTGEFLDSTSLTLGSSERHGLAAGGDALYAPDGGGGTIHVIDLRQPSVSLLAPYTPVGVGEPVFFQSTAWVPLGQIVSYEWDLDGDGVYELNTGTDPEARTVYREVGALNAGLRVTSDRGGTAIDRRNISVVVPPPAGPVGVSINNGDTFTRDPDVTVTLRWPRYASMLLISNDGGFVPSAELPVEAEIPWRLDPDGPQRQPKTIYVRFGYGPETYQDDIILDRNAPRVRVTFVPVGDDESRLFLAARDKVSGVASMQLMRHGEPRPWRRFAKSVIVAGSADAVRVRVRDRAGNRSAWIPARRG
jgi:DNA-binding beta-propeller fold protein YncE